MSDPCFDTFWGIYPRRVAKGNARKAWDRAISKAPVGIILASLSAQFDAGMFSDDPQFVPHPATWLNREGWEDDIIPRRRPKFRNGAAELLAREMMDGPLIEDDTQRVLEGPGR